jgi:hypothetical protein
MLTAFFLKTKGWSVDRLLQSRMTLDEAQRAMDADMAKHG